MKLDEHPSLSLANLLKDNSSIPWIRIVERRRNWSVNNNVSTQKLGLAGRVTRDWAGWGDLPIDIWWEIGNRLMSPLDILLFCSVCKKFRSSLPRPSRFPLWVPPLPTGGNTVPPPPPCVITQVSIYTSRLVRGCLVFEEVERGGWYFYAHRIYTSIFGTNKTSKLDSLMWLFHPYMQADFVSAAYHLRVAVPRVENHKLWDFCYNTFVSKMVIISSNAEDTGVNSGYASMTDLSLVARVSEGTMKGSMALLRLDGPHDSWAWDTDFCTQLFLDIATYRGRLCAFDAKGGVVIVEFSNNKSCVVEMVQLSPPWPRFSKMTHAYIFEDGGDLYVSDFSNLQRIQSYNLNMWNRMWVRVQVS